MHCRGPAEPPCPPQLSLLQTYLAWRDVATLARQGRGGYDFLQHGCELEEVRVPLKVRDLMAELERAGFVNRGGVQSAIEESKS
jgi:hypothetical protein